MATKVWKGFVSFGLLSIPVYLNTAARDKGFELHHYHVACNGRVKKPDYCPACEVMLQRTEIYKGYEESADTIVQLTAAELEAITPATERVMEIKECVKWDQVDPIYLAESFYLLPDDAGKKAYSLLVKTLTETGRVALSQLTKSSREHVAVIRPRGNGLMVHYLWYPDEIAEVPEFNNFKPVEVKAGELKLATQLVESLASDFQPEQYSDGYRQRLTTLVASKLDSAVKAPEPVKQIAISASQDITALLMSSLKTGTGKRAIKLRNEPVPVQKAAGKKGKSKAA